MIKHNIPFEAFGDLPFNQFGYFMEYWKEHMKKEEKANQANQQEQQDMLKNSMNNSSLSRQVGKFKGGTPKMPKKW